MSKKPAYLLNWNNIDTVFLDMDGTLLDLHYDNQFWNKYLPQRYAEQNNISLELATAKLSNNYKEMKGKLEWYSVDYWATQLNMDIGAMKIDLAHLIAIHPYVSEFLQTLRQYQKRVVLVTNAHHKSLSLKMQLTQLANHFDRIVCAHDLGFPKEAVAFWQKLQTIEPFNVARTLFIDDSLPVLRTAANYGIANLLGIHQPDTQSPPIEINEFEVIRSFQEIMPSLN